MSDHEEPLGHIPIPKPEDWHWIRSEINKIVDEHDEGVWARWAENGGTLRLLPRIGEEPDFKFDPDWSEPDD